jgi:hypothetical protein
MLREPNANTIAEILGSERSEGDAERQEVPTPYRKFARGRSDAQRPS